MISIFGITVVLYDTLCGFVETCSVTAEIGGGGELRWGGVQSAF